MATQKERLIEIERICREIDLKYRGKLLSNEAFDMANELMKIQCLAMDLDWENKEIPKCE